MGKENPTLQRLQERKDTAQSGLANFDTIISTKGTTLFQGSLERSREQDSQSFPLTLIKIGDRREAVSNRISTNSRSILAKHINQLEKQIEQEQKPLNVRLREKLQEGTITQDEFERAILILESLKPTNPIGSETVESPKDNGQGVIVATPDQDGSKPDTIRTRRGRAHRADNSPRPAERRILDGLLASPPGSTTTELIKRIYAEEISRGVSIDTLKLRFSVALAELRKRDGIPEISTERGGRGREARYTIARNESSMDALSSSPTTNDAVPASDIPASPISERPTPAVPQVLRPTLTPTNGQTDNGRAPARTPNTQPQPRHIDSMRRNFMDTLLNERERKLYGKIIIDPNLTTLQLVRFYFGRNKVTPREFATVNTLLFNLGAKMQQHTDERIVINNPEANMRQQTLRIGALRSDKQTPQEEPAKKDLSLQPSKLDSDSQVKHTSSEQDSERFIQTLETLTADLAETVIRRFAGFGSLYAKVGFTKDPVELMRLTSVTESQLRLFLAEIGDTPTPAELAAGYAMNGIEQLWAKEDKDMIGASARETNLHQVVQKVKRDGVSLPEIATQLYGNFDLPTPPQYRAAVPRR